MKQIFPIIALIFLVSAVSAQSLVLKNTMGATINNGDTLVFYDSDSYALISEHIYVQNISSQAINVAAKKTELSVTPNTINYYCWVNCYPSSIFYSLDTLNMPAGHTETSFTCDYEAEGHIGVSFIRYTFWNTDNPNDSISFVAHYRVGPSDVNINTSELPESAFSKAYPNPTKSAFFIDYDLTNIESAEIELLNVVGSVVRKQIITGLSGKIRMDVSDLDNGIYFYNIIADDKKIISKRIVIQN